MSKNALITNENWIPEKAESLIKKLPVAVRECAYAGEKAVREYNATRNNLAADAVKAHEKAAEICAVQFATLKRNYNPKKDEKAVCKTWGELAKDVFGISAAWFSRLSCIGERWYLSDTDTAKALREMFTPSIICELLPIKEDKALAAAIESGELHEGMSLTEVREWVDANTEHEPKVVEKLVILNPITGETKIGILSDFLADYGIDESAKIASVKTGVKDELSPTLSLEWTAHFYAWPDKRGCDVLWTHKHKTPKPSKDDRPLSYSKPEKPEDVLRHALEGMSAEDKAAFLKELTASMNK